MLRPNYEETQDCKDDKEGSSYLLIALLAQNVNFKKNGNFIRLSGILKLNDITAIRNHKVP